MAGEEPPARPVGDTDAVRDVVGQLRVALGGPRGLDPASGGASADVLASCVGGAGS